jgi:hypothetical protein
LRRRAVAFVDRIPIEIDEISERHAGDAIALKENLAKRRLCRP